VNEEGKGKRRKKEKSKEGKSISGKEETGRITSLPIS